VRTFAITGAHFQYAPGNPVIKDVDLVLTRGEVHGLVGENGAGKSTLIDLLTGALAPQRGSLMIDGAPVAFRSVREAQDAGVAVVRQHYSVFPDLSVVDNIMCIGRRVPRTRRIRQFDRAAARREVRDLLARLAIGVDPDVKVRALGAAERKMVEIARVVRLEPAFLILDEPTAALEPSSSRVVLDLMGRLRSRGLGLCFVSHRLDEVLSTADRVTVLRNAALVTSRPTSGMKIDGLAKLMVGDTGTQPDDGEAPAPPLDTAHPALRLRGVRVAPNAAAVNLDLAQGEIVGVTGLIGSGASRLVRMVGGAEPLIGDVEAHGAKVSITTPREAQAASIGFIPENRKEEGFLPDLSVTQNMTIARLSNTRPLSTLDTKAATAIARAYTAKLDIRARSLDQPASTLSGGNLQKVLIAKWLTSDMKILAIDEPTHGVDIAGKARIHRILKDFAGDGGAVIVSVSDSHEAMQLCHRVAVMRHGEIVAVLKTEELTQSQLAGLGADSGAERIEALLDGTA
jgi:ABC-type sugar transport system ATPase subunit